MAFRINSQFNLSGLKIFLPQISLNDMDKNASFNYGSFITRTIGGFDKNTVLKKIRGLFFISKFLLIFKVKLSK
jgi:hypothetical protein